MSVFTWCSRRAPGLSIIALVLLSYWAISEAYHLPIEDPTQTQLDGKAPANNGGGGIWTYIFAYYTLFIHVLVFLFPIRACWSVLDLTSSIRRTSQHQTELDFKKLTQERRSSTSSLTSSETLISDRGGSSSATSEAGDYDLSPYMDSKEKDSLNGPLVRHAIVIPNYKEELDTMRETLEVLASHPAAIECYDVSFLPDPLKPLLDPRH